MGAQCGGTHPREGRRVRHSARRLLTGAASLVSVFAILAIVAAPAGAVNVIKWGSKQQIDPPEQPVPAHGLRVSCPTKRLCVAVDNSGQVIVSTDPHPLKKGVTPSKWFKAKESDAEGLKAVSCLPSLCVAVDTGGHIVFSTHPSSKTAAWSGPTLIDSSGLSSISCPSSSLCIAGDNVGNLVTSTDRRSGRRYRLIRAWAIPSTACRVTRRRSAWASTATETRCHRPILLRAAGRCMWALTRQTSWWPSRVLRQRFASALIRPIPAGASWRPRGRPPITRGTSSTPTATSTPHLASHAPHARSASRATTTETRSPP